MWLHLPNGPKRNCSSQVAPEFALSQEVGVRRSRKNELPPAPSLPAGKDPFLPSARPLGCGRAPVWGCRSEPRTRMPGRGRARLPERAEDEASPRRAAGARGHVRRALRVRPRGAAVGRRAEPQGGRAELLQGAGRSCRTAARSCCRALGQGAAGRPHGDASMLRAYLGWAENG